VKKPIRSAHVRSRTLAALVQSLEPRRLFTQPDLDPRFPPLEPWDWEQDVDRVFVAAANAAGGGYYVLELEHHSVPDTQDDLYSVRKVGDDGSTQMRVYVDVPGVGNASHDRIVGRPGGGFLLNGGDLLAAFNDRGDLDQSFGGGDGVIDLPDGAGQIVTRPNGKIVVAGGQYLRQFNADGTPDTSFVAGGSVALAHAFGTDRTPGASLASLGALGLTASGSIVIAGATRADDGSFSGPRHVLAARLMSGGHIDRSYGGGDGVVSGPLIGYLYDVMTDVGPDGSVAALDQYIDEYQSPYGIRSVIKFTPDGRLDPHFGVNGARLDPAADLGFTRPTDLVVDARGRVDILGEGAPPHLTRAAESIAVMRLRADGSNDTTFSQDSVAHYIIVASVFTQQLLLDPHGGLLALGGWYSEDSAVGNLVRFRPNGDTSPVLPIAEIAADGTLIVRGAPDPDAITSVERSEEDPTRFVVTVNGDTFEFPAKQVRAVRMTSGDDFGRYSYQPTMRITVNRPATLIGGTGDDMFFTASPERDAGRARAVIYGGKGNDSFDGGSRGADDFNGGPGFDRANYSGRTGNVIINLNNRGDDGAPGEGDNIRADVEQIDGGAGNDLIVGNPFANYLSGNAGNDTIWGGGGDDTLGGDAGSDAVYGQGGNDTFYGYGVGARDWIYGGAGDDTLSADVGGGATARVFEVEHWE
jgi:hypothetical protein